jgi:chemotaxis protein MotB
MYIAWYIEEKPFMMKIVRFALFVLLGINFVACVPMNQFSDVKKRSEQLEDSNRLLKDENRKLIVENNELGGKLENLIKRNNDLEERNRQLLKRAEDLEYSNNRLNNNQKELERQIELLRDGSSDEISKLLSELQTMQRNLQEREDRVREAEEKLDEQEQKLQQAQKELEKQEELLRRAEQSLQEQQARMLELQDALDKQKDAVSQLREKLTQALRGFYDQGLSVHEKNGKVYVSLEENLMFRTGSYNVDPAGQSALQSLSEVLAANPGISIMVEGHTDDVPLSGTGAIKDNWDLSVMRATAVTKIILGNKGVDPNRIIAAGRSEYVPLDDAKTPEARQKNRRTEIILTPDLSEVLEIIQSH